jgi:hypothetical protein
MLPIRKADGHTQLAIFRLGTVSAESPVPDRQTKPEIAIMFVAKDRMVNAVHVRRNDAKPQPSFDMWG